MSTSGVLIARNTAPATPVAVRCWEPLGVLVLCRRGVLTRPLHVGLLVTQLRLLHTAAAVSKTGSDKEDEKDDDHDPATVSPCSSPFIVTASSALLH